METLGDDAPIDLGRPFNTLLLENDKQRADALLALLVRLTIAEVRVVRMDGGTRRSLETLEHSLTQAAGPDAEACAGDAARSIVHAIAKRHGHEKGVMLLIKQAEIVHPTTLRALQALAPYFVHDGGPTLRVTFVGRPAFLALLDGPGLTPLRQALGFQDSLQAPEPGAADTFVEPAATARPRASFPKRFGANEATAWVEATHDAKAARLKTLVGAFGDWTPRPLTEPQRATGSNGVGDGVDCREPTLAQLSAALLEPSAPEEVTEEAAQPALASAHALPRRRPTLRLVLTLGAVAIAAQAAYFGLHALFYRDVPARSSVSVAALPPALPSPQPIPSIPYPSTPASPMADVPPSTGSAAPLAAEPPAQLRRDFDAFLANSGRNVAAMSDAQRDALFAEYLKWRSQNVPAAKLPGAMPGKRIVIHIPTGSDTAEALSARLLGILPPEGSTVEFRRVATTSDHPTIRYFHSEDEPAAQLTARWMANTGLNWTLQDFSTFRPLPSRGTIEVWLTR